MCECMVMNTDRQSHTHRHITNASHDTPPQHEPRSSQRPRQGTNREVLTRTGDSVMMGMSGGCVSV